MQTVKDKLGDVKQAASNHVEDAKIGVKNKIEDVEDTVANKKDDSKGAVSDNMKKYYNTNKFFFLLRILFIIANFAEVLLGILVFIFALIGLLISPQLATIATRMIISGIGMVTQGLFALAFSSLCFCCKGLNATCLRMTFLSSFTTSFELLFFGGSYLFFEKGWINNAIVNGNKSLFFKLTLDHGGDINTLVSTHFIFLRIAAILCLIGFVVVVICCFLSVFLLKPEYYLKQMPYIEHQIIAVCGTEFIFLGSFFKVLDIYSGSPDPILTTVVVIGSVIDWTFIVINILRIFCKKWHKPMQIIRIILVVIAGLASLACAIVILVKQKDYNSSAHDGIQTLCLEELAKQSVEPDDPVEPEDPEDPEDPEPSINGYGGKWKDRILSKRDYDSIGGQLKSSSLSQYVQEHLSSSFTHLSTKKQIQAENNEVIFAFPVQDKDIMIKNKESGADKCASFIPNVERVYGCNQENATAVGLDEFCANTTITTSIIRMICI
ncbi:MAG: hypothetical protein EZS28_036518, partial [Streblomastix strix]